MLIHLFQHFVSITLLLHGRKTLGERSLTVGIISIEYLTFWIRSFLALESVPQRQRWQSGSWLCFSDFQSKCQFWQYLKQFSKAVTLAQSRCLQFSEKIL